MKAYFAVNGTGLGHVKRCETIAENLAKEGWQVVFSTYLDGLDYARRRGFQVLRVTPLTYGVDSEGMVDYKATTISLGMSLGFRKLLCQIRDEVRHLKALKPDVIFSDSRASTILAAKILGFPTILLINQVSIKVSKEMEYSRSTMGRIVQLMFRVSLYFLKHILEYIWSLSDLILIPDFPPPSTISLYNLGTVVRHKRKVRFIGPLVEVKRNIAGRLRLKRELGIREDKPLVYVPISGPRYERRILVSRVMDMAQDIHEFQFAITEGEPTKHSATSRLNNLVIFPWVEDELLYTLLKACDVVVSRAGHGTIVKAISYGKPMVLIPIPRQNEQISNAKRVKELGFGEILGQEWLNASTLRKAIENAIQKNLENRFTEIMPSNRSPTEEALRLIKDFANHKNR